MLCVHCFACAFYKVKKESALSPDDVETFYLSRDVDPTVSECVQITSQRVLAFRGQFWVV